MNLKERQEQLNAMKVAELKALAAEYQIKVSGKKADIIQELINYEGERDMREPELQVAQDELAICNEMLAEKVQKPYWSGLVCQMNTKDGKPHVYEHMADRPLLQQILLYACRDLYLDSQRAVKAANGDKSVKQFGPTFVSKKHKCVCMKDAMAKGAVKESAKKVLSEEQQKKYIALNTSTKHTEFKQAVQVLEKLDGAGLIKGHDTDKSYAKFYTVYPDEILAFLKAVGCLKQND